MKLSLGVLAIGLASLAVPGESYTFGIDMVRNAFHSLKEGFDCNLRWPLNVKVDFKWKVIPKSVDWEWEGVGVCKKFNAENEVEDWSSEFGCWGPILDFAWTLKDRVADLDELDAGTASELTSSLITAIVKNQVCLAKECTAPGGGIKVPGPLGRILRHFCLRSGKDEGQTALATQHDHKRSILMALPPIDLELYADFITRMAGCYAGGLACRQLSQRLKEYASGKDERDLDSVSSLVGGFVELKNRLVWYVTEPLKEFVDIISGLDGVVAGLKTCQTKSGASSQDFNTAVRSAETNTELAQGLEDAYQLINDTISFGQELKEIYNMTKTLDTKKPSLEYIKKVAQIPHTIADLIEAFRGLKSLPGQILNAAKAAGGLDALLNSDMPTVARSIKPANQQGNNACKKAMNTLQAFGVQGFKDAYKAFDISGVINRIKQIRFLRLSFNIGAPNYRNYLSFKYDREVPLPDISWSNQCMDRYVEMALSFNPLYKLAFKGIMKIVRNKGGKCLRRPTIRIKKGKFPDIRVLPGFLPFIAIKTNMDLPKVGTRF